MQNETETRLDKNLAAACGLYCAACSWFLATQEAPERLKRLADQQNWPMEESGCYGCRSAKRLPYCGNCKMSACTKKQGIDFCSECAEYPCQDLKQFQSAMPHRIELWSNLARIKSAGWRQWLQEIGENYTCPQCQTVNSTYDRQCRQCGHEPSCRFVANHQQAIEQFLKKRKA